MLEAQNMNVRDSPILKLTWNQLPLMDVL